MPESKQQILWPGWETTRLIGRGSFGTVYEIRREMFGETEKAALKVISIPQNASDIEEMYNDGYDDESITSTFQTHLKSIVAEYSLMRKLNGCSNVVNCDDIRYVQHNDGIGWDVFIKMELLTPLPKAVPADISDELVFKVACDICTALDLCSKHSIVHRDIKPQNIFVSPNGDYKLGDFGIAKIIEKTAGGTKIGTHKYMAPEVYHYKPYGSSADIYSLGLVLYWLLNERRLPFLPLPSEKVTVFMEDAAKDRRLFGEQIPVPVHGSDALKRIVLKACAYAPGDRYQSAREMLADLKAIGDETAVGPVAASVDDRTPERITNEDVGDMENKGCTIPFDCEENRVDSDFTRERILNEESKPKIAKKPKRWGVVLFLAIFPYTGLFGVHDFYLGRIKLGILKSCTANFGALGWIVDIILVAVRKYKTREGEYLK